MLSILRDSKSWFADGTFKVVPQQFYQLYTIHAEKDGRIFPCVYSLVTAKTEITYRRILRHLVELEPGLDPSYIIDFEKAAINAFEEQFLAFLTGCFFHFFPKCVQKNSIKWFGFQIQWNLVNTNTVNTNFRLIRTNIYRNSGPYNGFSIEITSLNTNSE